MEEIKKLYEENSLLDLTKSYYQELTRLGRIDIKKRIEEAEKNGFMKIYMSTYGVEKEMLNAYNSIQNGNPDLSLMSLYVASDQVMEYLFSRPKNFMDMAKDDPKRLHETVNLYHRIQGTWKIWKELDFPSIVQNFAKPQFFPEGVDMDKIDPLQVLQGYRDFTYSKAYKSYHYKVGKEGLFPEDMVRWDIHPSVILHNRVSDFLSYVKGIEETPRAKMFFMFRVDKTSEYFSNFVFAVAIKDHIFLYTDEPFFVNPDAKKLRAGRAPLKNNIDRIDLMSLPFWELLDIWDDRINKTKTVALFGNDMPVTHVVPLTDLKQHHRFGMLYFSDAILTRMRETGLPDNRGITGREFIDQKLLTNQDLDYSDIDEMGNFERVRIHTDMMLKSLGIERNKLVKYSYSVSAEKWDDELDMVKTPEEFEHLSRWYPLREEANLVRKRINEKIGDVINFRFRANNEIIELLGSKRAEIFDSFSEFAKTKFMYIKPEHFQSFGPFSEEEDYNPSNHHFTYWHPRKSKYPFGIYMSQGYDRTGLPKTCPICHDASAKYSLVFNIVHYSQLMWLLKVDRLDLPLEVQNYRRHNFIPYTGNHLLDESHPLALIQDPMSRAEPNGIDISIHVCGNCRWNAVKKHTNESYAIIKSSEVESLKDIEILKVNKEEFDLKTYRYSVHI